MISIEKIRERFPDEDKAEYHLTADETRLLFDVYEAACAWRDTRDLARDAPWREDAAAERLCAAINTARGIP
jgi:hypothetical protein